MIGRSLVQSPELTVRTAPRVPRIGLPTTPGKCAHCPLACVHSLVCMCTDRLNVEVKFSRCGTNKGHLILMNPIKTRLSGEHL